jgi:hypothetical protein
MGEERVQIHMKNGVAKSGFEEHKRIQSVTESSDTAAVLAVPSILKPNIAALPLSLPPQKKDKADMVATAKVDRTAQPDVKRKWNTEKLGLRMGVDALSAGAAGALVAPIITMIDKGIIENASGRRTLIASLKESARELLLRPHRFVASKPFALIFVRPKTLHIP